MAVRSWVPSDLGAAVTLWVDTLDPATYVMNADGVTVNSWSSKVGSIVLNAGSGRPRKTALIGGTAFLGGSNFAYFIANATGVFPSETSDATIMFVGYGTGSYNPSLRLSNSGSFVRGIGTVDTAKAGLPKSGNDLASAIAYAATGNIVIGEWLAGASARATIWVDGIQANTRTIANTSVVVNRVEILNNGNNASNVDAVRATVIVNRTLTLDERQRLEGWAAWNLGYVDRLPANHAYKAAAPTVSDGAAASVAGTAGSSLSGLGVASAARLAIVGAASLALAGIASTSTSSAPIAALAEAPIGAVLSAGAGGAAIAASGAVSLQWISAASSGTLPLQTTGSTAFVVIGSSGVVSAPIAGSASATLEPIGTVSGARADVRSAASTTLGSIACSSKAAGQSIATASATVVLGSLSTRSAGSIPVTGNATSTLATIVSASHAVRPVAAAGEVTLGTITARSTATARIGATGTAALDALQPSSSVALPIAAIGVGPISTIKATSAGSVVGRLSVPLPTDRLTRVGLKYRLASVAGRHRVIQIRSNRMSDLAWPSKPVGERARHRVDWTDDLAGGDTIVSSKLEKLSGSVEMTADGHDTTQVFCWLEGGLPRTVSRFSSTIVTAAGARLVATIAIRCD